MTTHIGKRCVQCGVHYYYQGSGWGAPDTNDSKWCPSCYQVCRNALKHIERRFELRRQPIADNPIFASITIEMLVNWRAQEQAARDPNKIYGERVVFPLYNLETGDHTTGWMIRGRGEWWNRFLFTVTRWRNSGEYEPITADMEYDLLEKRFTGQPWP